MQDWEYVLLFLSVFAGGSAGFFLQQGQKKLLPLVLSFSGAYIMGIVFLHMMPWVFSNGKYWIGLLVLAGFFIQLLLEQLSAGVEHGHIHAPQKFSAGFIFSVMLGLSIHAFTEGIPLSYYESRHALLHGHTHSHNHLLYGIILHHIPAAFALVFLMTTVGLKKKWIWFCLFIFSIMSPLGAATAESVELSTHIQLLFVAFAMGSLLHIATVILFEMDNTDHHFISWRKLLAIGTGLGISVLTVF